MREAGGAGRGDQPRTPSEEGARHWSAADEEASATADGAERSPLAPRWRSVLYDYQGVVVLGLIAATALAVSGWLLASRWTEPLRTLRLAAGDPGGAYLPVGKALARTFENAIPHLRVEVLVTAGSKQNAALLEDGSVELALLQNDAAVSARVRTVAPLYEEYLHLVARQGMPPSPLALRGKRIAVGEAGSGTRKLVEAFLPMVGLSSGTFEPVSLSPTRAVDALRLRGPEGVDAFAAVVGLPSAAVRTAVTQDGGFLVKLAEAGGAGNLVEGFRFAHPWVTSRVIPRGTYGAGPEDLAPSQPIGTVGVLSLLACRDELERTLVGSLAEAIYDRRSELVRAEPLLASLHEGFDRDLLQFPLHGGARRWLDREKPPFLVAYAETMGFLLSAMLAILALASGGARWLAQRKKNRIDEHYKRLHGVLDELEQLEADVELGARSSIDPAALLGGLSAGQKLNELEKATRELGRTAFRELVDERLAANESFVIFQNLLAGTQEEIRRRLAELSSTGASMDPIIEQTDS